MIFPTGPGRYSLEMYCGIGPCCRPRRFITGFTNDLDKAVAALISNIHMGGVTNHTNLDGQIRENGHIVTRFTSLDDFPADLIEAYLRGVKETASAIFRNRCARNPYRRDDRWAAYEAGSGDAMELTSIAADEDAEWESAV